ncbi:hypothetical protein BDF19DRAFT_424000 [Syncephalis fuscata]|nr:hypothetical protein BDF19DRAFT_424000 [Syncephalis fuscata]
MELSTAPSANNDTLDDRSLRSSETHSHRETMDDEDNDSNSRSSDSVIDNNAEASHELDLSPEEATLLWNTLSTHRIQWNTDGTPPTILSSIQDSHNAHTSLYDGEDIRDRRQSTDNQHSWTFRARRMVNGLMALARANQTNGLYSMASNQSASTHPYDELQTTEDGQATAIASETANDEAPLHSSTDIGMMPLQSDSNDGNTANTNRNPAMTNRQWAANDPAITEMRIFCADERRRLRYLMIQSIGMLALIAAIFGIVLYNMDAFYGENGPWDTTSRGWHLYMGFLLFCGMIIIMLLMAYGIRVAELHMHFTSTVEDRTTAELLERYQQHRQRQIRRLHRTRDGQHSETEDNDEDEEDIPLGHRMAYERRRLNRRFQRAIDNQTRQRRRRSNRTLNHETLDVDPTLLAPPPPTYTEASLDPPAYDTIKPESSSVDGTAIPHHIGTSNNNSQAPTEQSVIFASSSSSSVATTTTSTASFANNVDITHNGEDAEEAELITFRANN